jgi:hypothetical protein
LIGERACEQRERWNNKKAKNEQEKGQKANPVP